MIRTAPWVFSESEARLNIAAVLQGGRVPSNSQKDGKTMGLVIIRTGHVVTTTRTYEFAVIPLERKAALRTVLGNISYWDTRRVGLRFFLDVMVLRQLEKITVSSFVERFHWLCECERLERLRR
jgi:hypothetical protein